MLHINGGRSRSSASLGARCQLLLDADPERRVDFTSDVLARYLDWAPRYEAAAARSLAANIAWSRR